MEQLNTLFETFYYQFIHIVKFVFIFKCASEVIKKSHDGFEISETLKIVFNYAIAYGVLFGIIRILDSVEAMFK